jgi:hypothetical protein
MRASIALAWVLALLGASCFSPKYHNGGLRCAASGECPENYHCAADYTCWQNGSDPDAGADAGDVSDAMATPDLPLGPDVSAIDMVDIEVMDVASQADRADTSATEAAPTLDLPTGEDTPDASAQADATDVTLAGADAEDAPAMDVAAQADSADTSGTEAASTGVPLDQLAAEYARVVCNRNFACCTPSDTKGKTLASCQQNVANLFKPAVDAVSDGVSRGRTVYFPDRARECLLTLEATNCQDWPLDPVTELPAICANSIEPQISNGGACRSLADCISGLCIGASSSADGTCMRKVSSGETCEIVLGQNTCEPELYCDSTKKCSATKIDGTSCAGNLECKSLTCGPAPDAGSVCLPAACYSNGPLIVPACSFGGRPSAFAAGFVLAALAWVVRRRRRH